MGVIVEPILESRFVDETRWIGVKDLVGTQKSAAAAAAVIVLAVVLYASIVRMCLASWEFLLPVIKRWGGGRCSWFSLPSPHTVFHTK